jgi:alginate O-acetyltransferase complex protein AlgI
MLFCSEQFLGFFALVFLTYWSMPTRWLRVVLLVLVLGSLAQMVGLTTLTWNSVPQTPAQWWDLLAQARHGMWLAVLAVGGLVLAFVKGADRARVWFLLGASFFFYACWNRELALLIGLTTTLDYWVGRGMERAAQPGLRRTLLVLSLIVNLGLLVYFKYANFFLRELEEALHAAGAQASLPVLQVILPVGISFYTFEAINYTVDIYRGRARAERNLANFMLFITFFPHLVAGPIVRARDFLPQIARRKRWDWNRLHVGVQLFLMGLCKKLVIADRMAYYVDSVFKTPELYSSQAAWCATIAYALQIYCDFSGYSDMALGCAHLLGYHLTRNFNMPYLARNIAEFWHRWHISLSTWLRDYLFIPLGGSRGGRWRTVRNLMLTMVLGGLWHGASWTFVLWGALHGALLVGHRMWTGLCAARPRLDRLQQTGPGIAFRWFLTMLCVGVGWVFFRAQDVESAWEICKRLFLPRGGLPAPLPLWMLFVFVAGVAACHVVGQFRWWPKAARRWPAPAVGLAYALLVAMTLLLAADSGQAFIYFQF